jgi:PGAP1-like protein
MVTAMFQYQASSVAALVAPRGGGRPVLVIPGWHANDLSTLPLRSYLSYLGYRARGWGLGTNQGRSLRASSALTDVLSRLAVESEESVSIVGWSLGGVLAIDLAARQTDQVRQVITLGSPLSATARVSVPLTSIYSRDDRIVHWRLSQIPKTRTQRNIEVHGSHLSLGHNPEVFRAVGEQLARPKTVGRESD